MGERVLRLFFWGGEGGVWLESLSSVHSVMGAFLLVGEILGFGRWAARDLSRVHVVMHTTTGESFCWGGLGARVLSSVASGEGFAPREWCAEVRSSVHVVTSSEMVHLEVLTPTGDHSCQRRP